MRYGFVPEILWLKDSCTYNRFALGTWDDEVCEEIAAMLSNDAWLEQQLTAESSRAEAGIKGLQDQMTNKDISPIEAELDRRVAQVLP